MDDSPHNQTQNELIPNNNDEKTSANYNPPQIEDNKIQQEGMQTSQNSSEQFPPPQPRNLGDIYKEPNIPNPGSRDLNNPPTQTNPDSNII